MSYFDVRGRFLDGSGNALSRTSGIAYADNWVSTLFSQITVQCNGETVELLNACPQSDTSLLYSSVTKSYLKSFGSAMGVGEAFTTRILKSAGIAAGTTPNSVTASWRPCLSLFDTASGLPPGPQWTISFSWSPTAEQNMIESVASAIAGTNYTFTLDEFTLYCCTLTPDESVPLPMQCFVELNPVAVNQYTVSTTSAVQLQVPLPASANRMLVVCQDNSTAAGAGKNNVSTAGGFIGTKALTSFAGAFSDGTNDLSSFITQFYVSLSELGVNVPNPAYNFTAGTTLGSCSGAGWERAFSDWCIGSQGNSGGYEGSVSLGNMDTTVGAVISYIHDTVASSVVNQGDPNNDQVAWLLGHGTSAPSSTVQTTYSKSAGWGYLGRVPGPILLVPIIRPPGVSVSNAALTMQLSSTATSVNIFCIISHSMGLEASYDESRGVYEYRVVRGL